MMQKLKGLITEEKGQGMTEYGLVLGLIAVAVVAILVAFREEVISVFEDAVKTLKDRDNITPADVVVDSNE